MSFTRAQCMTHTREMMDAVNSSRWSDAEVTLALGIISGEEWSSLLGANPYYRFASRTVTTDSTGQFAYTTLNGGSGDTAQNWYRILAITDGNTVYRQTGFIQIPLATTTNYDMPYMRLWYDAGTNVQILPVTASLSLTVYVNHVPPSIDQLSADSVVVDFPSGHESILWLAAGAYLLEKGGAEPEAAAVLKASASARRQQMYQDLSRRSARPLFLTYPDTAAEWGGSSYF